MKAVCTFFLAASGLLSAADLGSATASYQAGKYEAARKELRVVVAAEPGNARAHHLLGMTLLQLGDTAAALGELQTAEKLQPGQADTTLGLAQVYLKQNDLAKAEAALTTALKIDPNNARVPLVRGQIELARKNYRAAMADLEKAVAHEPKNAYAHYYLALAYNGVRKVDKMIEHFNLFLALAPDAPEAARARALTSSMR